MERLKVETGRDSGFSVNTVTGFTPEELEEIGKDGIHYDSLVRILNERNEGLGTCWSCGYGIYGVWIRNGVVYVRTGSSCD